MGSVAGLLEEAGTAVTEMGYSGTCGLCGERIPAEDVIVHLQVWHDVDVSVEEWPDGSAVIIDRSLEPDDFKGTA